MEFLKSRDDWLTHASKAGKMDSASVQKEILTNNIEMDYSALKNMCPSPKFYFFGNFELFG